MYTDLAEKVNERNILDKKEEKKRRNAEYDSVLQSKVFIVLLRIIARQNCQECLGINLRTTDLESAIFILTVRQIYHRYSIPWILVCGFSNLATKYLIVSTVLYSQNCHHPII